MTNTGESGYGVDMPIELRADAEQAFALAIVHATRAKTWPDRTLAALALYDLGVPSVNPDPEMRSLTERHRWGMHGDRANGRCPVCERQASSIKIVPFDPTASLREAEDARHLGHS